MEQARGDMLLYSRQSLAIILGASAMLSLSMGMRQSLGLFLYPMTRDIAVSAADFTLAIAVQNIVWGITQPFIGALADSRGYRPVLLGGSVLFMAGLTMMLLDKGGLALIWGGALLGVALSCTATGLTLPASARAVAPSAQSVTLGLVSAAGSIGTFIAAPLAQELMAGYGWRIAMLGFIALATLLMPAAFFTGLADKLPKDTDASAGGHGNLRGLLRRATGHRGFVVMSLTFFVCGLQLVFITTHLPTYLILCGQDPMLSAQALALLGGFNVAGSYLFGWLGSRYPKHLLLGGIYVLRSLCILVYFATPPSSASTLLFAAIMGLLWLGVVPLMNGLVAQYFGLRYLATLTGIAFLSHQVGSFVGAFGGGLIFDALGSYDLAWRFGVSIGILAGLIQMLLGVKPASPVAA